jgi:hypothetical protein
MRIKPLPAGFVIPAQPVKASKPPVGTRLKLRQLPLLAPRALSRASLSAADSANSKPVSHPDVTRGAHRVLGRTAYMLFLLAILSGSFFITLWITAPQMRSLDSRSHAERLAAYPISNGSELAKSAYEADLIPSQRLDGRINVIRRLDERKVDLAGWAADWNGTALQALVFVAGHLVATTHTAGERPDVTAALRLGSAARTNIALYANFSCRKGEQPVVVILGNGKEYLHLRSAPCP